MGAVGADIDNDNKAMSLSDREELRNQSMHISQPKRRLLILGLCLSGSGLLLFFLACELAAFSLESWELLVSILQIHCHLSLIC